MPTPDEQPPRRPFEHLREDESETFLRSPEFRRILFFAGLAALVGLCALYVLQSKPEIGPTAQPHPAAAPAPIAAQDLETRRDELELRFEGALRDSAHGQDFAQTAGYRQLVRIVAAFTPEEFSARVAWTLDPAAALREPDAWRGEFVRARGILSEVWAVKLAQPVQGIRDVWRGILLDAELPVGEHALQPGEATVVDLVRPPPAFDPREDAVQVEGIVYRTVRFEGRGGSAEAPYLIARNLQVLVRTEGRSFWKDNTGTILIGLAVVFLLSRLVMYAFQRRSRARPRRRPPPAATDFKAMFEKHLRPEDRPKGPPPTV